jgi:cyclohexyl-isocyanide hydratase
MLVGMLLFPDVAQLDFTGPHELLSRLPGVEIKLIASSSHPIVSSGEMKFIPDAVLDDVRQTDVLFVPGGPGVDAIIEDRKVLEFLRRQADGARFVTSVCTGSLLLGAAGLLKGYRATTHWMSLELLPLFGAIPMPDRVVIDRNRITGAGVTSGLDFGLVLAGTLFNEEVAKAIQLGLEYNPSPPFACGHPSIAEPSVVERVLASGAKRQQTRLEHAKRAAQLYC